LTSIRGQKDLKEGVKDKDKEKDKDIDKETKKISLLIFDEFRKIFPGTRKGNQTEYDNFCKKHKDWPYCLQLLKPAVENQIKDKEAKRLKGVFVPEWKNLQTWINQRCWEEEITLDQAGPPKKETRKMIVYNIDGSIKS